MRFRVRDNFKAIAFDLDSTIIDFMRLKNLCCEQVARAMVNAGLNMEVKEASQKLMNTYLEVGIESDNAFSTFLKEAMGRVDEAILAAGIQAYLKTKEVYLEPYPRVIPTLIALIRRGYKLAIVTDAPKLKAHQRLASMKLTHFFDAIITRDDTNSEKNDVLPFRALLKKLELKPEEVVMVGDNPERDVRSAKKLGMTTILAKYGRHCDSKGEEDRADYEIDRFEDLLDIL